jgi:fructose-1,6-bisphosphatase I
MKRITLSQFLVARQRDKKLINADLRLLIETIARACKGSARASTRARWRTA